MVAAPALIAVLIALMACLLIYALIVFGKALAQIFPSSIGISVASIHPRAWVLAGVDALQAGLAWIIGDVIRPMVNFVLGPVMAVVNFVESVDHAISEAASGFEWLVTAELPQLVADLRNLISAVETSVKRVALALYHDAVALLSAVETRLLSLISAVETRALAYAHSLYADAIGELSAVETRLMAEISSVETHLQDEAAAVVKLAEAGLIKDIDNLAGTVQADLTKALAAAGSQAAGALSAAEAYATTAAAQAVGVLTTDVDAVLAPAVTGVIDDVGSLVGTLGTDFPDVQSILRDLDLTKIGSLAGGLLGALTITRALTRLAEDCTVPNCRNLSQYGRDLQALLDLAGGAAFLALLASWIRDPADGAREVQDVLGAPAQAVIGQFRDLVGV